MYHKFFWKIKNLKCDLLLRQSFLDIKRKISSVNVAIVGSGPSGFYTAQGLLKNKNVRVDIYEKAPVPFGLIRFGVAPDHPEVKNVINSFNKIAQNPRVTFNGNISVGKDISLQQLRDAYNIVVLCYGSTVDKTLNIKGENLPCVIPAKKFVGWYNGVEEDKDLDLSLDSEEISIIGQGNVALDCARILLTDVDSHLKNTDITSYALDKLRKSKVKKVFLIGRRGPLQVAFKIKELREISKIKNLDIIIDNKDLKKLLLTNLNNLPRPRKRLTELLLEVSKQSSRSATKQCILKFLRSPLEILPDQHDGCKIKLGINKITGNIYDEDATFDLTNEIEYLNSGLVLRSIGYKAVSIDESIPINEKSGIIENEGGKIKKLGDDVYCSGWAATGASGVILGTMNSSFEISANILKEIELSKNLIMKPGRDKIMELLENQNIKVITYEDWMKIDKLERVSGEKKGKIREKFVDSKEILNILKKE